VAKKAPHPPRFVAMIHAKPLIGPVTKKASAALSLEHVIPLGLRQPVTVVDLPTPRSTTLAVSTLMPRTAILKPSLAVGANA